MKKKVSYDWDGGEEDSKREGKEDSPPKFVANPGIYRLNSVFWQFALPFSSYDFASTLCLQVALMQLAFPFFQLWLRARGCSCFVCNTGFEV